MPSTSGTSHAPVGPTRASTTTSTVATTLAPMNTAADARFVLAYKVPPRQKKIPGGA